MKEQLTKEYLEQRIKDLNSDLNKTMDRQVKMEEKRVNIVVEISTVEELLLSLKEV